MDVPQVERVVGMKFEIHVSVIQTSCLDVYLDEHLTETFKQIFAEVVKEGLTLGTED